MHSMYGGAINLIENFVVSQLLHQMKSINSQMMKYGTSENVMSTDIYSTDILPHRTHTHTEEHNENILRIRFLCVRKPRVQLQIHSIVVDELRSVALHFHPMNQIYVVRKIDMVVLADIILLTEAIKRRTINS